MIFGRRGNDQRVGGDVGPNGHAGIDIGRRRRRGPWTVPVRRPALRLRRGGGLTFQLVGNLFGVRVAQITHLDIAARRHGRVHVDDQRLEPQRADALAGQQDAVGALIGDDFGERAAGLGAGTGIERIDDSHHIGGAGIVQGDDLDGFIAAVIHALDDAHDAAHIAGAIRNDQHIAAGIGRQMPIGRHQGTQHRHQLRRRSHSSR